MSFILDALKRAERERRLERAPDLGAIYEESDMPQSNLWPWLSAGVAFLVGAVVVALLLWPQTPPLEISKNSNLVTETASRTPTQGKPLPVRPKTGRPSKKDIPSREVEVSRPTLSSAAKIETALPAKTASQPTSPQTSGKEIAAPIKVASKEPENALSTKETSVPARAKQPLNTSSKPVVSKKTVPDSRTSESKTLEAPDAPPSPAVVNKDTAVLESAKPVNEKTSDVALPPGLKAKEEPVSESVAAVPLLKDLPDKVRRKMGKLEINVHGYAKDPSKRLVFINMRKYRAGDRIGNGIEGPILKMITPDGVIIDYGEGLARLTVR